jgi:hypothetical protein
MKNAEQSRMRALQRFGSGASVLTGYLHDSVLADEGLNDSASDGIPAGN